MRHSKPRCGTGGAQSDARKLTPSRPTEPTQVAIVPTGNTNRHPHRNRPPIRSSLEDANHANNRVRREGLSFDSRKQDAASIAGGAFVGPGHEVA
jgi:hypothetical protein